MQENPKALYSKFLKRKKEIHVSRSQNWVSKEQGEDPKTSPELSDGCGAGSVQRRTSEQQMPASCAAGLGEGEVPAASTRKRNAPNLPTRVNSWGPRGLSRLGDSCGLGCPLVPRNQHSEGTRALLPGNRGSPKGGRPCRGKRQPGSAAKGGRVPVPRRGRLPVS